MIDIGTKAQILPSQKSAAALAVISQSRTVDDIVMETGATASEVKRWVYLVQECTQELFSNQWGERLPRASVSKDELRILRKQLMWLIAKIDRVIES